MSEQERCPACGRTIPEYAGDAGCAHSFHFPTDRERELERKLGLLADAVRDFFGADTYGEEQGASERLHSALDSLTEESR